MIKYQKMNKYLKLTFLIVLVVLGFILPLNSAKAIFGFGDIGLLDIVNMALDALDAVDTMLLPWLLSLWKNLVLSQFFLSISSRFLEWAMNLPLDLNNPLVTAGFNFTRGLANLSLILIFIAIAFAYIFKAETFGMKKALPKLILVAFLINFSLLFVKILADIAQITLNAIVKSFGSDLPTQAIQPLLNNIGTVSAGFLTTLSTYFLKAIIPFANVAGAISLVLKLLSEAFLGSFSIAVLLVLLGFGMASIFLFLAVLFLFRIGIVWILAILAPLAFVACILPKTEGIWKKWLEYLIEWLLLGIALIFFVCLSLGYFGDPDVLEVGTPLTLWGKEVFPVFSYNYLFLIIYLVVVSYLSKTLIPKSAQAIIAGVEKYTPMAGKRLAELAKTVVGRSGAPEVLESWGERLQQRAAVAPTGIERRIAAGLGYGLRRTAEIIPTPPPMPSEKTIAEAKKTIAGDLKVKKGETLDGAAHRVATERFSGYNQAQRIAAMKHFAQTDARDTFLSYIPGQYKQAVIARARGTDQEKILLTVAPEKFAAAFGKTIEEAVKKISISDAHKISAKSLEIPEVVVNLSIEQLNNIKRMGDIEKGRNIFQTVSKMTPVQQRQFDEQSKYMARSPYWMNMY